MIDSCLKAAKYPKIKLLILRRTFPELERSLIRSFLENVPGNLYDYNTSKHFVQFKNGSTLEFGYATEDKDIYKYQSAEYDIVYIDEATHMSEYQIRYIQSRIRGANDYPKQLKLTSNPGNQSHVFLRERFIEPCPPMTTYEVPGTDRNGRRPRTRIFIPSSVYENKFLMEADEGYITTLEELPETERRQLLEGDWYVFSGQFFPEFRRDVHVFKEPPARTKDWRMYFTCDYGLDCFAGYFIAENDRGFAYVLGEIHEPNLIVSEAVKRVKDKQKELGITKVDEYLAPSDLWNRRQETGKSVADIFYENGIRFHKASRERISGWAATKEWLTVHTDEQGLPVSKLNIHESCVELIRSIPSLQYDPRRPSDAATTPHDITHSTDALRYFCVTRTRANKEPPQPTVEDIREQREYNRFNNNDMFDVYGRKNNNDDDTYNPMYL